MELTIAVTLPAALVASSAAGWALRAHIGEHHREPAVVESLRVLLSMLVTFAALVLGLLTSSAKSDFDAQRRSLQAFSMHLIELDQRLHEFGPEATPARAALRRYLAASIADSWPGEPKPGGDYPAISDETRPDQVESPTLGNMLLRVDEQIGTLTPATALQRLLLPVVEQDMSDTLQARWQFVAGAASGLSWPFLAIMVLWLTLAFLTFGLSTPPSRLTATVLVLAAISMSTAVYLIVDFGTPLTGLLSLPSAPMRDALAHIDAFPP